jgi:hypothetical protein
MLAFTSLDVRPPGVPPEEYSVALRTLQLEDVSPGSTEQVFKARGTSLVLLRCSTSTVGPQVFCNFQPCEMLQDIKIVSQHLQALSDDELQGLAQGQV